MSNHGPNTVVLNKVVLLVFNKPLIVVIHSNLDLTVTFASTLVEGVAGNVIDELLSLIKCAYDL